MKTGFRSAAAAPAGGGARLQTIQALRTLAIGGVLIGHALHEIAVGFNPAFAVAETRFPSGFGVDLFFVVSGFIMMYATRDVAGSASEAWEFARRRIVRIVPLYWITTTAMVAAVLVMPGMFHTAMADAGHFVASYLFVPYAREADGAIRPILALGWSLQYEMYFYAVVTLGLFLPRRFLPWFVAAVVTGVLATAHSFESTTAIARFLRDPIVAEFAFGALLGQLYLNGARLPQRAALVIAAAAAAYVLAAPFVFEGVEQLHVLHYGVPSAALVAVAVLTVGADTHAVPRWIVDLGDASYAIYLTHPFVIGVTAVAAHRLEAWGVLTPAQATFWFLVVVVPAAIAVGDAVHRLVDKPLTNWLRDRTRPDRTTPPGFAQPQF